MDEDDTTKGVIESFLAKKKSSWKTDEHMGRQVMYGIFYILSNNELSSNIYGGCIAC